MEILKKTEADSGGGGIEMLSTHPLPETRMNDIRKIIDTDYQYTKNNPEYGFYEETFKERALDHLNRLPKPSSRKNQTTNQSQNNVMNGSSEKRGRPRRRKH